MTSPVFKDFSLVSHFGGFEHYMPAKGSRGVRGSAALTQIKTITRRRRRSCMVGERSKGVDIAFSRNLTPFLQFRL